MMKQTLALIGAILIAGLLATASLAATAKCTVTEIKESTVILDCGTKADRIKVGDTVKVKTVKKQAIEGC